MSNTDFSGSFEPQLWRDVIWSITSVFESGRPAGNLKAFQNSDAGIISFGRHQATLLSGSLGRVLEIFFRLSQSPVSQALQQEFGERIKLRDATLRNNLRLKTLLIQSADEAAMAQAQDEVFEMDYYRPAVDHANRIGVHTPLGLACLYDTQVQGGLQIVTDAVTGRLGASRIGQIGVNGLVNESTWIKTFLNEREARLNRLADKAAADGQANQAQALRISVFRVQELNKLVGAGNWGLVGRFSVRGQEIVGLAGQVSSQPAGVSDSLFVSFQSPDNLDAVIEGDMFTASWRLKNIGTTTWGDGFKVGLIHQATGSRLMAAKATFDLSEVGSKPTVAPGEEVEITIKMIAPAARNRFYFSDWQLQDNQNRFFGHVFFVRVVVVKKPVSSGNLLNSDSQYVQDLSVQDGSVFPAGSTFEKRWLVRNNGQRKWGSGYRLVFVGGDSAMTGTFSQLVAEAQPGEEVVISLPLVAPTVPRPEAYVSTWRIHDDRNVPFGDRLWIKIFVTDSGRPLPTTPLSQHDSRWADFVLGNGPQTIGQFGCLLTCMAMMLNGFEQNLTPLELNQRFLQLPAGQGFNGDIVFFVAPANAFSGVKFNGNFKPFADTGAGFATFDPNLIEKIDQHLAGEGAALAQVDRTPATAYNANVDQHWVVLITRTGDDYLVLDPLDGSQTSLMAKYGRQTNAQNTFEALKNSLKSVAFYTYTSERVNIPISNKVAAGMNINPDDGVSNPFNSDQLKGLAWVRFPFKAADKLRTVAASFAEYDPIIKAYADRGVGSLVVLNQQTVAGDDAPWRGNGDWNSYANKLAQAAQEIASHYAHFGDKVAYEIWNEGDNPATPFVSVFVPPAQFAIVLQRSSAAIRAASPQSKVVFGGLSTGPVAAADYVKQCRAALNGQLPIDAIGIHPYGRWPIVQPFADWGFGRLDEQFNVFKTALADIPLWITEIGIPGGANPLGAEHYPAIARYLKDTFDLVTEKFSGRVPVIIWFAWSDNMENAGIVKSDGSPKAGIFETFKAIRDRV